MTEATTLRETKPRSEVRVGDVAPEFIPGAITCFCGARSQNGYFHMSDSNGRSSTGELAEKGRPGYQKGDALWDGRSVVCSACSVIYDRAA